MLIGGFQKCSLIEYPGEVSAVLFTTGCNFRCTYCYNPELVFPKLHPPPIPEKEIISFMKKRRGILDALVITGGEPTLQEDLLIFIEQVRDMGFKVKLDTNGSFPEVVENAAGLVDYIAMDVKGPLDKYARIAGAQLDIRKITGSIEIIKTSGVDYEFRTTVASGLLTPEDMEKIGGLISGAKLHYLQNFLASEKTAAAGIEKCSAEQIERFRGILQKHVGECRVR